MNELFRQATSGGSFGFWEILTALVLSLVLVLVVTYFYRQSHRGLSYSVSFVHAMVLLCVTVSVIMLIIGSNIARAFTLVGALSIIRFRNPIKDSRDVAFLFVAMAVGMAVGTGFYMTAVMFTLFISFIAYALTRFEIGATLRREVLLKLAVPASLDYHTAFNDVFYRALREQALLSVETLREGATLELVYSIEFKAGADEGNFLDEMRRLTQGGRVVLLTGQENIDV
ncbi:MAG TPA: DUF4956 domain-containing protein [Gemmatimonadales bacterium]